MAKDIFSRRDISRFKGGIDDGRSSDIASGILAKARIPKLNLPEITTAKKLFYLAIIVLLLIGFLYLDSRFYIIKDTQQEKAGKAAEKAFEMDLMSSLGVKNMAEARNNGYLSSGVKTANFENNSWQIEISYKMRISDLARNTTVNATFSKFVKVNNETLEAEIIK